ncbi:extensin [Neorhizobium lilium]|uniref:Extensin n=1 Tax=Neorhizobium lilium TaxID=2503024 RepID=A0A3S3REH9_9HYPH|nr:extensin family protein [Neorhizobium lilium]RWX75554.1 extensin [Neorhizobium lilium]
MAYALSSRRAVALLMITTMLAACSSADLVPPASIDSGTRVGAIRPSRGLPPQPAYQDGQAPTSQAPMSQGDASGYGYPQPSAGVGDAYTGDTGNYLRAPDQSVPVAPQAPRSMAAAPAGRLPMIDSDEAMRQTPRRAAPASPSSRLTSIPEQGVNIDGELGFSPDESDVTGLAEEEADNMAEGVGSQPVVDGIGTDNPRAINPRRQPVSDDRIIVPPKRQPAGLQGDMSSGSSVWNNGVAMAPAGRAPVAGTQQVAMLRPNNPMSDDGPISEPNQSFMPSVMPQSEASCRAELRRLGVEFQERPRISSGPSCGIDYPVKLSGLSGNIDVKPAVTLNCQTTLAFARWVKGELAPSARYRYLTGVQTIVPLGGYSCRRMNNSRQRYNPISEHAKGNAIDIGAIVLKNGHEIDVRKKGLFSFREGGLLKSVRTDSCKYFSTVLGPGSNAEHWNHFHFDLRSRKGSRRYCD